MGKKNKEDDHYAMCEACAIALGAEWPKDGAMGITVWEDFCPICGQKATMIPKSDMNWPRKGKKAVFD